MTKAAELSYLLRTLKAPAAARASYPSAERLPGGVKISRHPNLMAKNRGSSSGDHETSGGDVSRCTAGARVRRNGLHVSERPSYLSRLKTVSRAAHGQQTPRSGPAQPCPTASAAARKPAWI